MTTITPDRRGNMGANRTRQYNTLPGEPYSRENRAMATSAAKSSSWTEGVTGYLIFTILIATIGPLQFGFHLAELNAPEAVIRCQRKSITAKKILSLPQCIPMNAVQFGLVSSIFTLGGLLGAVSSGHVLTKQGRLFTMRLTSIFFTIGPLFEALAPSIALLSVGRFVSGIGAGSAVVVVPIYISEIAPLKQRGIFGAFSQVMTNFGILIAQSLGFFLSHDRYWRIILLVGGAIGAIHILGLLLVVESPKWTAVNGHPALAKRNITRIRGKHTSVEEEIAAWGVSDTSAPEPEEQGLLETGDSIESDQGTTLPRHAHVGIIEAVTTPKYRRAVIAVVSAMAAQQLCGINSIVMYSVSLLSKLLPTTSALLSVAVSAVNLIMSILCAPLIDKLGRKPCLLISIAGMGLNSLLLAFSIIYSISIMSIVATVLFVASFAVGLGPVPFLLATELVGHEAVGATQSWALASSWISTFLVAQFFPILNHAMPEGRVYFIFAALAAGFFAFITWWIPETTGKTSIEEIWGKED